MWRNDDVIFKTNLYFGFHLTTRKNSSRFQFLLSVIERYVLNLCLWFWLPVTERDGRVNLLSYRERDQMNDDDIKRMTQKYDCSCKVGQHWRHRHNCKKRLQITWVLSTSRFSMWSQKVFPYPNLNSKISITFSNYPATVTYRFLFLSKRSQQVTIHWFTQS